VRVEKVRGQRLAARRTVFGALAFAAITDAKAKAECEKAGGVWMDDTKKCGRRPSKDLSDC